MEQNPVQKTTFEFLADEVYLPGYMLMAKADYDKQGATFDFNVREPPVARENSKWQYLTPRGLHICISQAGYALAENMVSKGIIDDIDIPTLRGILLEGRVKITELYQKFRREVKLSKPIQGRFNVSRFRQGKMPILKLEFDLGDRAIAGNLTSVIAPLSQPQLNADVARF